MHVQNIVFPEQKVQSDLQNLKTKSIPRRIFDAVSDPLTSFLNCGELIPSFLAICFLVLLNWFIGSLVFSFPALGVVFAASSKSIYIWWDYILLGIFVASWLMIPVAYLRWGRFILDKNLSGWFRFFYSIGILFLVAIASEWELAQLSINSFVSLVNQPEKLPGLMLAFFGFQIPLFSFGLITLWDLCSRIYSRLKTLGDNLLIFHNPLPFQLIEQILSESVRSENKSWQLSELPPQELSALQQWAETNRVSSEKRVTPALFIVAIIGLLANTQLFDRFVQKVVNFLGDWGADFLRNGIGSILPIQSFLIGFVIIIIVASLGGLLFSLFINIFRNIVVQSLIIEACIVAEYAAKQAADDQEKERIMQSLSRPWWKRLFLGFRMNQKRVNHDS